MNKDFSWQKNIFYELTDLGKDILFSPQYQILFTFRKHGKTTTFEHVLMVAFYSLLKVEKKKIRCDKKSLVRGALLHDYYLYDWHRKGHPRLHGYRHPGFALKNAQKQFPLNNIEKQIIRRHMFPLTIVPPIRKEARIVCVQDKKCSWRETRKKNPYEKYKELIEELKRKMENPNQSENTICANEGKSI